jgi:FkbM family methyltransferase
MLIRHMKSLIPKHAVSLASQRLRSFVSTAKHTSYAQCGEDLIVQFILQGLRIARPTYLDLGAHHPVKLSNTYLFYRQGGTGVCVEPDPTLFKLLKRKRPRDTCLNVGVGLIAGTANFHVMTSKTLSTFSKEEAERYQSYGGQNIEAIVSVPIIPINQLIRKYFQTPPHFMSIDIEGLDLEVLQQLDFNTIRPTVLCVETLTYTEDRTEHKRTELIDFVCSNNYLLYADTYINSIFVERSAWKQR